MAADEHPNRRWPHLERKMRGGARASCPHCPAFCRTGSESRAQRDTCESAACMPTEVAGNMPAAAVSTYSYERTMPTQKFRGGHSPFSFKLHLRERKCAFASGNDQVFVAAQNFSGLAREIDN